MTFRSVYHCIIMPCVMSFQRRIDVTALLPVSILSFCNIFCSGLIWYSASRCNFNDIDVITIIGTVGTLPFGNFATTQIILNKDNFYLLQNNTNKDQNANICK